MSFGSVKHFNGKYSSWDDYHDGVLGLWHQAWVADEKSPRDKYVEVYGAEDAEYFFTDKMINRITECASSVFDVPEGQFSEKDCDALYLMLEDINFHSLTLPRGELK